jgi:hypothetical protein
MLLFVIRAEPSALTRRRVSGAVHVTHPDVTGITSVAAVAVSTACPLIALNRASRHVAPVVQRPNALSTAGHEIVSERGVVEHLGDAVGELFCVLGWEGQAGTPRDDLP